MKLKIMQVNYWYDYLAGWYDLLHHKIRRNRSCRWGNESYWRGNELCRWRNRWCRRGNQSCRKHLHNSLPLLRDSPCLHDPLYFIYMICYLVCTTLYSKSGGNESCQFFPHYSLPREVTNRARWAEEYYHIHFSLNSCLYFKIKRFKVSWKDFQKKFKSTFKSYRGKCLNS